MAYLDEELTPFQYCNLREDNHLLTASRQKSDLLFWISVTRHQNVNRQTLFVWKDAAITQSVLINRQPGNL